MTIIGNVLVILSVCVYKRMRTFTNILLISLATSGVYDHFFEIFIHFFSFIHSRFGFKN